MQDRNEWEIKQLKEKFTEMSGVVKKNGERLHDLELFKASTVDKLLVIFDKLEELQEGDQWIKRVFITALVGAVLSAVFSLIVWGLTN